MTVQFQASLLDEIGPDEGYGDPALGRLDAVRRTHLSRGAWVDVLPGWVSGADDVFVRLVDEVPWHAERRQMYDREVDVPRLLSFYDEGAPLPHPLLSEARDTLTGHYLGELGEPFVTAGATTGTGETASRGTATGSAGATARTRWSRSCPSVRPAGSRCARAVAVTARGSPSGTAT
jgi:hypothetical protein